MSAASDAQCLMNPLTCCPHCGVALPRQGLSESEWHVLRRVADGWTNPQIAAERTVSPGTVKTQVISILTKLGLANRVVAAVAYAQMMASGVPLDVQSRPETAERTVRRVRCAACGWRSLTPVEQAILQGLVAGCDTKTIARTQHLSIRAVKGHLTSVYRVLKVTSRTQAVLAALRLGILGAGR